VAYERSPCGGKPALMNGGVNKERYQAHNFAGIYLRICV